MSVPSKLDTYVTDDLVIEPEVGLHKTTGEVHIVVKIYLRKENRLGDVKVFSNEAEYNAWINDLFSRR